jgi:hypothetical protein
MSTGRSPIKAKFIAYLLGLKKMPRFLPECYSPGDASEAMFYTKENLEAWKIGPGAFDCLLDQKK